MALGIREIERILPHRYPFLLVDRVDEIDDAHIVARKLVTRNEPHFEGHFPGHPVMPGVLIIEALAQAGALYAARIVKFDPDKQVIYFMAIDKAKFRKPVVPGDVLRLEVVPLRKGGVIWKMRGEAKVGDDIVAEAEFMASIQPKPVVTAVTAAAAAGEPAQGGS
jgi:3-hydroxyacyl-[acyl-carrier-protein] dehydratase